MSIYNLRRSVRLSRAPLESLENSKTKSKPKNKVSHEASENDQRQTISNLEKLSLASISKPCKSCKGHDEFIKSLQDALKEVLDQNETLRKRIIELEAQLTLYEDRIEEKNEEIAVLQKKATKMRSKSENLRKMEIEDKNIK
ncbi:unnamed protein product [Blepharisma stoltei]|uniref:Uncharacterized protein n=1 Tax=Blepharisma stoltei TaxID=1481888 RepID=A0AAU9JRG6_9CILI|nr:unnamed protein product [Blepharisma stoltei]